MANQSEHVNHPGVQYTLIAMLILAAPSAVLLILLQSLAITHAADTTNIPDPENPTNEPKTKHQIKPMVSLSAMRAYSSDTAIATFPKRNTTSPSISPPLLRRDVNSGSREGSPKVERRIFGSDEDTGSASDSGSVSDRSDRHDRQSRDRQSQDRQSASPKQKRKIFRRFSSSKDVKAVKPNTFSSSSSSTITTTADQKSQQVTTGWSPTLQLKRKASLSKTTVSAEKKVIFQGESSTTSVVPPLVEKSPSPSPSPSPRKTFIEMSPRKSRREKSEKMDKRTKRSRSMSPGFRETIKTPPSAPPSPSLPSTSLSTPNIHEQIAIMPQPPPSKSITIRDASSLSDNNYYLMLYGVRQDNDLIVTAVQWRPIDAAAKLEHEKGKKDVPNWTPFPGPVYDDDVLVEGRLQEPLAYVFCYLNIASITRSETDIPTLDNYAALAFPAPLKLFVNEPEYPSGLCVIFSPKETRESNTYSMIVNVNKQYKLSICKSVKVFADWSVDG